MVCCFFCLCFALAVQSFIAVLHIPFCSQIGFIFFGHHTHNLRPHLDGAAPPRIPILIHESIKRRICASKIDLPKNVRQTVAISTTTTMKRRKKKEIQVEFLSISCFVLIDRMTLFILIQHVSRHSRRQAIFRWWRPFKNRNMFSLHFMFLFLNSNSINNFTVGKKSTYELQLVQWEGMCISEFSTKHVAITLHRQNKIGREKKEQKIISDQWHLPTE